MKLFPKSAFARTVALLALILLINQVVSYVMVSNYVVKPSIEQINELVAKHIRTMFIPRQHSPESAQVRPDWLTSVWIGLGRRRSARSHPDPRSVLASLHTW